MINSKKGISPLIATVLILGFTVALAAIIMTWGTKFTRDIQASTSEAATANVVCAQDVMLEVQNVCRDVGGGAQYKILTANNGNVDITKFNVRMYKSESDAYSDTITDTLAKFSLKTLTTAISGGASNVKKVELIPSVVVEGKTITCSANVISYGDVDGSDFPDCT